MKRVVSKRAHRTLSGTRTRIAAGPRRVSSALRRQTASAACILCAAIGCGEDGTPAPRPSFDLPNGQQDCSEPGEASVPPLELTSIASGLSAPVYVAQPPGDDARLFVVEKAGLIRIIEEGQVRDEPFLDLRDSVDDSSSEMGLLGLAFHPAYADNGRLYVYHSAQTASGEGSHESRVVELSVMEEDPNRADASTARVVLTIQQPESNHNGGALEFGPDGYLYVASGDGGGAGDRHGEIGNGQDLGTLLGKMLRIDVDGRSEGEYGIPPGNLVAPGARPEIWSYGLRNPWRFSFDPCSADLYIADVGQNAFEEVNFEPPGTAGRNYGWRLMEAEECFEPADGCDARAQGLTLPVASYDRQQGVSITGGYVYRGSAIPDLRGTYLYADFQLANFFALRMRNGQVERSAEMITDNLNPGRSVLRISSFGQDSRGELYVVSLTGSVYRIDPE